MFAPVQDVNTYLSDSPLTVTTTSTPTTTDHHLVAAVVVPVVAVIVVAALLALVMVLLFLFYARRSAPMPNNDFNVRLNPHEVEEFIEETLTSGDGGGQPFLQQRTIAREVCWWVCHHFFT